MVILGTGVPGMVPRAVTEATQGALSHSMGFEPFSRSLAKTLWFHGLPLPSRPWAHKLFWILLRALMRPWWLFQKLKNVKFSLFAEPKGQPGVGLGLKTRLRGDYRG